MGVAKEDIRPRFQSTLLREERPAVSGTLTTLAVFQSTLLREERQELDFRKASSFQFQSTLLREERRHSWKTAWTVYCFNPRSYVRSDKHLDCPR